MIHIHLYGDLRRFGSEQRPDRDTIVTLPIEGTPTVAQVLAQVGIPRDEVAHIFLNSKLLKSGSSMAPWLGYQTAEERRPAGATHWETPIQNGDRLGIFPTRMALLVI